jgi:hypothetical protein
MDDLRIDAADADDPCDDDEAATRILGPIEDRVLRREGDLQCL